MVGERQQRAGSRERRRRQPLEAGTLALAAFCRPWKACLAQGCCQACLGLLKSAAGSELTAGCELLGLLGRRVGLQRG